MRIGVDVGGTKIEVAVLDDRGKIRLRERSEAPSGDYRAAVEVIRQLVEKAEAEIGRRCPVGLGIPGTISPATGLVKNAVNSPFNGHPLARDVEHALERPVRLMNDANCFALSEAIDGNAADGRIVFGAILGTGCGGGIVIDGAPLIGCNAIGGEWGHNPLPWAHDDERPGRQCNCGKFGCIETFLSGTGFAAHHNAVAGTSLTTEAIVDLAEKGDPVAEESLRRYEDRLARALASVINVLDPDVVVLGGGMSNIRRLYRSVPALWTKWVFSDRVDTRLVDPKYGDSSGVRGAAWLWPKGQEAPA